MGLLGDSARVWLNAMLDPSNSGSFPDTTKNCSSQRGGAHLVLLL